jgi:hypothetical protein
MNTIAVIATFTGSSDERDWMISPEFSIDSNISINF